MTDTIIVPGGGAGELGAAAVAAAQSAGHADANATQAKEDAQKAVADAEEALAAARGAQSAAFTQPTYEETRRIAREESLATIMELDALAKATEQPVETPAVEVNVEAPSPEVEPPSVAKANKDGKPGKRRAIHKWLGIDGD